MDFCDISRFYCKSTGDWPTFKKENALKSDENVATHVVSCTHIYIVYMVIKPRNVLHVHYAIASSEIPAITTSK